MALKFCANLSFMFTECGAITHRYTAAKNCGLQAVEVGFPYEVPIEDLVAAKENNQLQQILINSFPGDVGKGQLGFAAIPGKEKEFESSLALTFKYAEALKCPRIHFLSGKLSKEEGGVEREEECFKTLESNLRKLLPELEKRSIIGLIEPINNFSVPNYILNDFDKALRIVQAIDSPFIRLQLDLFHLQQIHGNLSRRIKDCIGYVGHIQIAQVPTRNEPDSPGEINYDYIFQLLQSLEYNGWIGLEYIPAADTHSGLKWITNFGLNL